MKKFLLCLILLLLPLTVSAQEVKVSDINLTIDITDDWMVFTRENLEGNEILASYGITADYMMNLFKSGDIYIDALPESAEIEFFALVKKTTGLNNLSNYPDGMIEKEFRQPLIDELKKSYDKVSVELVTVNDTKYFIAQYYDKASNMYMYKYYTIINSKGYNFQLQKQGEFTDEEKENLKKIVSSAKIEVESSLKEEPKEAQKEIEKYNNSGSKNKILIFVIIGVVVGMVVFAIVSTNKKQA